VSDRDQMLPAARIGASVPGEDLPLPLLVLKRTALDHNIALMQSYCDEHGVQLAPHGKTTMSPGILRAQIAGGAWGITVATAQQAILCRSFGARRVIVANQVVGAPNLALLAQELNASVDFDLYFWVDSVEGVAELADAHARHQLTRPWQVLLEVGWPGGRTGAQTQEAIDRVTAAITASEDAVRLVGVSTFEGLLDVPRLKASTAGQPRPERDEVTPFLHHVTRVAAHLRAAGLLPADYILSGGGSSAFDKVTTVFGAVEAPVRVLLRSGCYVTHDHGMYAMLTPLAGLRPALELWSYITSIPEPGRAFLGFGKRDAPYDHGLPVPLSRLRPRSTERLSLAEAVITDLHDHHAAMNFTGDLRVGDRVVLGISHPCAAFDRWRLIPIVDDDGTVVDVLDTYF
jgi:D-serine dehydratase